jgi:hypothetical protein
LIRGRISLILNTRDKERWDPVKINVNFTIEIEVGEPDSEVRGNLYDHAATDNLDGVRQFMIEDAKQYVLDYWAANVDGLTISATEPK